MTDRLMNQVRNAAISMEIGVGNSGPAIDLVKVGDSLFVVMTNDIYTTILADQIDPNRTNIKVPNAQQKVCDYGASDKIVGATLLTGKRLIQPVYQKGIDHDQTMQLVFNCTQELIGLRSIEHRLTGAIQQGPQPDSTLSIGPNAVLPHTSNLVTDLRTYFEKTKQLFNNWADLIRIFFPAVTSGQLDKLLEHLEAIFPTHHRFKSFLKTLLDDYEFCRLARNAVVHPKVGKEEVQIFDFALKPDHTLMHPVFGLISPGRDYKEWDVVSFLKEMTLALIEYTEILIANLACYSASAKVVGGFDRNVTFMSVERQSNNVRMSYSIMLNGTEQILG
jgi:hypothetical protein